ncbi:MAG: lysophospholipid acyltransferase family protein [Phycisphaerae bacterium]|nr:lysophospholipid acyltransferase family protein [Phycisphaerae bacterium]
MRPLLPIGPIVAAARWLGRLLLAILPIHWLQYVGIRAFVVVLHLFPIEWNLRTARVFGRIWRVVWPRHYRLAKQHLRLAYGDSLAPEEVERIALRSMQHLIMMVFEMAFAPRLIDEWTWRKYVQPVGIEEALQVMLRGKGALLLTAHFGGWELAGYLLATYGFDIVAIMRPLDNEYLNRFVVRTRQRRGLRLINKKGATAQAEDIIRSGAALGFIADQNAGSKGMFVDFFGVKASAYKSIGLLAMDMEVPIIVGYARRVGDRFFYEVGVQRIIYPHEWQDQADPLRWITQEYTTAIETFVRKWPEQYLWIHRRWKSRPKAERLAAAAAAAG